MGRSILLAALLASLVLGLAPTARAARVEINLTTGTESDQYIQFTAARGERNRVRVVRRVGPQRLGEPGDLRFRVTITDTGVRRLQGSGCRNRSAQTVICRGAFAVSLDLGDGNDRVSFDSPGRSDDRIPSDPSELAAPFEDDDGAVGTGAVVVGGPGDDVIFGTPFPDIIFPGPGRDRVMARGGPDTVIVEPDGARDFLKGDAGVNALKFSGSTPVTVDTRAGRAGAPGQRDKITGFRRITGGGGDDTLLGGDAGEALYGNGGNDRIDGRGGADLIVGDSPRFFVSANRLLGGPGDDLIDARSDPRLNSGPPSETPPLPTSTVTCGDGSDRVMSDTDDFLDPSCEAAVYRVPALESEQDDVGDLFAPTMPIVPVSRGADGAPTFDVPCPMQLGARPFPVVTVARCVGSVALERPPTAGSTTPPEQLGSGSFDLPRGQRAPVAVTLNDAGRQALATPGTILAVHVTAVLNGNCPPGATFPRANGACAGFGWQEVF
jgi:Ca2+-binding RTX toxin-like protein